MESEQSVPPFGSDPPSQPDGPRPALAGNWCGPFLLGPAGIRPHSTLIREGDAMRRPSSMGSRQRPSKTNTITRRARILILKPAPSRRPAHCCFGSCFIDLQMSGDLIQHDPSHRLIGGCPSNIGDDTAGGRFTIAHWQPTACLGSGGPPTCIRLSRPLVLSGAN
jgi:hypothetical protein